MKYEPFKAYLLRQTASQVPLTFAEIERIIGQRLPSSARKFPAWWSNNPSNNVMTTAWLDAGYESEKVDIGAERLVFRRASPPLSSPPVSAEDPLAGLYGAMRDTMRLRPDVDLTEPTGEVWDADLP